MNRLVILKGEGKKGTPEYNEMFKVFEMMGEKLK